MNDDKQLRNPRPMPPPYGGDASGQICGHHFNPGQAARGMMFSNAAVVPDGTLSTAPDALKSVFRRSVERLQRSRKSSLSGAVRRFPLFARLLPSVPQSLNPSDAAGSGGPWHRVA